MAVTRLEEWCVHAKSPEEARVLLADGQGHRCHFADCLHIELDAMDATRSRLAVKAEQQWRHHPEADSAVRIARSLYHQPGARERLNHMPKELSPAPLIYTFASFVAAEPLSFEAVPMGNTSKAQAGSCP